MNQYINIAILPFVTSFLISLLATPIAIKLAWKFKILDDPAKHKHAKVIHDKPIPRGGGLPIYISILISTLIFLPLDKHITAILAGLTIILIMGLTDDYLLSRGREFSPFIRLGIQILSALIPIAAGIGIAFLTNPFGGIIDLSQPRLSFSLLGDSKSIWLLADLFALVWIVTMMNFVNIGAKGVDGQLSGVVIIAALTIAGFSLRYSADITQWPIIILASITAGSFLGFLPYHVYPQKIMPSFAGSNIAGYMLAVLSILSTAKVGTLAVVLAVPLIDTGYVIVRRLLAGKSPFWGDKGHLHHRLLDMGVSKPMVAIFYWIITGALGIAALSLNTERKLYTIVGIAILIAGVILWSTYRQSSKS